MGQNAFTVENKGGRNGAYGPGSLQVDLRERDGQVADTPAVAWARTIGETGFSPSKLGGEAQ